jgi:hypothetical protein
MESILLARPYPPTFRFLQLVVLNFGMVIVELQNSQSTIVVGRCR